MRMDKSFLSFVDQDILTWKNICAHCGCTADSICANSTSMFPADRMIVPSKRLELLLSAAGEWMIQLQRCN